MARVARVVRMIASLALLASAGWRSWWVGIANDARDLNPDPFPRGKGDRILCEKPLAGYRDRVLSW